MTPLNNVLTVVNRPGQLYVSSVGRLHTAQSSHGLMFRGNESETRSSIETRFTSTQNEIEELWTETEASVGQDKVSSKTYFNMINFIDELPVDIIDVPDAAVLPNGQLSLKWQSYKGDITIIVKGDEIHYGHRLSNGERYSGFRRWDGSLSRDIISRIRQVVA